MRAETKRRIIPKNRSISVEEFVKNKLTARERMAFALMRRGHTYRGIYLRMKGKFEGISTRDRARQIAMMVENAVRKFARLNGYDEKEIICAIMREAGE